MARVNHCRMYLTASNRSPAASKLCVLSGWRPRRSLGAAEAPSPGETHLSRARQRRGGASTMTLQFERPQGAMMLWVAGGISVCVSHTHTHTYCWILTSVLQGEATCIFPTPPLTYISNTNSLLSSQTTKKLPMFLILGEILFSTPSMVFYLFLFFWRLFQTQMAASQQLLLSLFWKKKTAFASPPTLVIWELFTLLFVIIKTCKC